MVSDANNNLFADLLGDCFAECEEHLAQVRRNLLALEPFVNQDQINRALLNEILRCVHSLKGLSGMVGAKEAEELAHQMESYLKALREKQTELTPLGFDALLEGTQVLEATIASHRDQTPPPAIAPTIAKLTAGLQPQVIPPQAIAPIELKLKPEESKQLAEAIQEGATAWHITFTPNATLAGRGINVNSIRERLQAIGELSHASPRMTPAAGITFDFVVASTCEPETTFAGWEGDGLTWAPYTEDHPQPPIPLVEAVSPAVSTPHSPPPLIAQPSNVVRVDLPKLDELMRMVGDLAIGRDRLEDNLTRLQGIVPAPELRSLREVNLALESQLRALREGVMRVRLVPIAEIFARMQFALRDLVRETQKQVVLELSGQETEIDKFVVERMMDPLLHLVRNAVSHGIEPAAERKRAGKPTEGKIALRAAASGEMVVICIEDDGGGIDSETVFAKARSLGLVTGESNGQIEADPALILDILCSPGFSTREVADLTSGRGVGMAIVKNTVQELGGFLTLETQIGQGTRFTIQLPLTLVIVQALIVNAGGQTFAIPQSAVREVIEVQPQTITILENNEIIPYRGNVLPLFRLASLFKLNEINPGQPFGKSGEPEETQALPLPEEQGVLFQLEPSKKSENNPQNIQRPIETESGLQTERNPNPNIEFPLSQPRAKKLHNQPKRLEDNSERELILKPKHEILAQSDIIENSNALDRLDSAVKNKFNFHPNNPVQPPPTSPFSQGEQRGNSPIRALVIGSGLKAVGLGVERIVGQREIVVRSLTDPLLQVFGIAGATELGDGRVVLILDAAALERSAAKFTIKKSKNY